METLKFLIVSQLKQAQTKKTAGFTLIELLVALVIAAIVITPLLGLAVNLLNTDRQEQAKSTSEQELQTTLDYMSRDLQQSVYIYDGAALTRNLNMSDAANSGIKDQIPPVTPVPGCNSTANCVPVLVFWKRRPIRNAVPRDEVSVNNRGTNCSTSVNRPRECDDTFVYSLVGYYLIFDNSNTDAWSSTARIGRFELTDGAKYRNDNSLIPNANSVRPRSNGFALFNLGLGGATLPSKMNRWRGQCGALTGTGNQGPTTSSGNPCNNEVYNTPVQILADFIDPTDLTTLNNEGLQREACPSDLIWTKSPDPASTPDNLETDSFYACINREQTAARVYIRGNALARITPTGVVANYSRRQSSYFPIVKTEVKGVGRLVQ